MCRIIPFNTRFDGTHMSADQIREEARNRGWSGIKLDASEFIQTGKITVRRLSGVSAGRAQPERDQTERAQGGRDE